MTCTLAEAMDELVRAMPSVGEAIREERARRYLERCEREMARYRRSATERPRMEAASVAAK
jgi:hypothetical protein